MTPVLVDGMKGLGDNIFQRPFVRALAKRRDVYLATPWPEIYADLPVRFCRSVTSLRTQAENEGRQPPGRYVPRPLLNLRKRDLIRPFYGGVDLDGGSIVASLERKMPLDSEPFVFDLPDMGESPVRATKPIAVIRPVTVRSEWRNEARNPQPEYVSEIARRLLSTHHVVAVAHLAAGQEWLEGELPPHHQAFVAGELRVRELLALVATADIVVGGVGWLVPAAIALKTRAFIILGGQGGHNAPAKITDPRMDLTRIGWARPTPYCGCTSMRHRCSKTISDLAAQWEAFNARTRVSTLA